MINIIFLNTLAFQKMLVESFILNLYCEIYTEISLEGKNPTAE